MNTIVQVISRSALLGLVGMLLPGMGLGATMTGSETFGDNDLDAGAEAIAQRTPNVFWWADPDGDGTAGPTFTSSGLDLAGNSITRNNSDTGFTLDLDHTGDGSVGGSITNGGNLEAKATAWTSAAGHVSITHARHIAVSNISVNAQQDAGQLTVRHTGNFRANNVDVGTSTAAQGATLFSGNQAARQTIEDLRNSFVLSGYITAKQTVAAALSLRGITIENYWAVRIDGTTSAYSIDASYVAQNRSGAAANVTITGIGTGGVRLLNADSTAGGIFTGSTRTDDNWNVRLGSVVISTAGPVELHNLITGIPNGSQGSDYNSGNATITAGGDISISGALDLYSPWRTSGTLSLTSSGGAIEVNALKLNRLASAKFSAPGNSTINGLLTGTDGNPASGLGNISTRLRTPAGQTIFYKPDENPSLNGATYTLASLAGTAGAGGELKPLLAQGTVITIR